MRPKKRMLTVEVDLSGLTGKTLAAALELQLQKYVKQIVRDVTTIYPTEQITLSDRNGATGYAEFKVVEK